MCPERLLRSCTIGKRKISHRSINGRCRSVLTVEFSFTTIMVFPDFFRPPFYLPEVIDLTPYVGSHVRIRYLFDTIDAANNDLRGWFLDDVLVRFRSALGSHVLESCLLSSA
jgi:hypothetical protein